MSLRERLNPKQEVKQTRIFEYVDVDIKEMNTVSENGKRFYLTPEGNKYPSVTTVLGILSAKAIQEWRKRVGEEEANRVSRRASTRGTAVHLIAEKYLNNDNEYAKDAPIHVRDMFEQQLRPVLDKYIGKIYAQEVPLYSNYLELAGRVDLVAVYNGKISIVDFKTSSKVKTRDQCQSYFMQEAAYAIMFEELTGQPIEQLVTIIACDDSPEPVIFVENRDTWAPYLLDTIEAYYKLYGKK